MGARVRQRVCWEAFRTKKEEPKVGEGRSERSQLLSDRGTTTNDALVVSIAGVAAREVSGAERGVDITVKDVFFPKQ